jgi:hypothetical protein
MPFAKATASMVLVLALVHPVDAADDSLAQPRSGDAAAIWDDVAWGTLPPRAILFLTNERDLARARAATVRGSLRGDVVVVRARGGDVLARRTLSRDPVLVPTWRDLQIAGAPSEASLSSLASLRPVLMAYEPAWGRAVARHLVADALFDRFVPEPRGASDRRMALDAFVPVRERLVHAVAGDLDLTQDTAHLLRTRALAVASSGDRDPLARAVEDLRRFAPDDRVADELLLRAASSRAGTRYDDLSP